MIIIAMRKTGFRRRHWIPDQVRNDDYIRCVDLINGTVISYIVVSMAIDMTGCEPKANQSHF